MAKKLTNRQLIMAILVIWTLIYGPIVASILTKPVPTTAVTSVGLVIRASGRTLRDGSPNLQPARSRPDAHP